MTGQITAAERAALTVADAALVSAGSPYGPADTIVFALGSAGLLQSPETAAELDRLQRERAALNEVLAGGDEERRLLRARLAELEPYEVLYPQECENGQHLAWFVNTDRAVACPWCEIARLQPGRSKAYRAIHDGVELAQYATPEAAGAHCESALRAQFLDAQCEWIARGDDSGALDLVVHHDGRTSSTDLCVIPVQIYAAFDTADPAAEA